MNDRKIKLAFLTVILAVIAGGVLVYFIPFNRIPAGDSAFPKTLQNVALRQVISGPEAIAMISKLHGSDIAIKQGYIALYQKSGSQIMIWVSESNSTGEAEELFRVMDNKISVPSNSGQSGQPPFTDRRELNVGGNKVIAVKGMGMENYYYQKGNKVYWIAAGGVDPIQTLTEYMKLS